MCLSHEFLGNLVEEGPIFQLLLGSITLNLLLFVVSVTWVVLVWAPHEAVSVAVVHPFLVQYLIVVFLQGHGPSHEAAVGVFLHDHILWSVVRAWWSVFTMKKWPYR